MGPPPTLTRLQSPQACGAPKRSHGWRKAAQQILGAVIEACPGQQDGFQLSVVPTLMRRAVGATPGLGVAMPSGYPRPGLRWPVRSLNQNHQGIGAQAMHLQDVLRRSRCLASAITGTAARFPCSKFVASGGAIGDGGGLGNAHDTSTRRRCSGPRADPHHAHPRSGAA